MLFHLGWGLGLGLGSGLEYGFGFFDLCEMAWTAGHQSMQENVTNATQGYKSEGKGVRVRVRSSPAKWRPSEVALIPFPPLGSSSFHDCRRGIQTKCFQGFRAAIWGSRSTRSVVLCTLAIPAILLWDQCFPLCCTPLMLMLFAFFCRFVNSHFRDLRLGLG